MSSSNLKYNSTQEWYYSTYNFWNTDIPSVIYEKLQFERLIPWFFDKYCWLSLEKLDTNQFDELIQWMKKIFSQQVELTQQEQTWVSNLKMELNRIYWLSIEPRLKPLIEKLENLNEDLKKSQQEFHAKHGKIYNDSELASQDSFKVYELDNSIKLLELEISNIRNWALYPFPIEHFLSDFKEIIRRVA